MPLSRLALIVSALFAAISVGAAVNRKPPPGPEQTTAEQDAMIASMVTGLAQRLETEPKNVEGWIMLMRSYAALGRMDEANNALVKAKAANPEAAKQIDASATEIGLTP
jgi:cytochrome c-type biogenesis protein CcmH/NrfG